MPQIAEIEKIKGVSTVFVIFGATGDLARKKIFPSFFELSKQKLLPQKFKIIAAARSEFSKEQFRESLQETIKTDDSKNWEAFAKNIDYLTCDLSDNNNLDELIKALDNFEEEINSCPQRIFYLAVSPHVFEKAFENLGRKNLSSGCRSHNRPARIVIEKPFGYDYNSAQHLNKILEKHFTEEQIYRIDHYLGKETVQNIFAFRFGNEIFEPVWNNKYVDHVQITLAEDIGIEKRGEYYDQVGALRDFVQNHLLQLLAIVTMERPEKFEHLSIRNKKLDIIKNIRKLTHDEVIKTTVHGQYEGYRQEEKVNRNSLTETYAQIKLFIENERWQGVPFYLRTGKKLTGKVSSIIFSFKERGHEIFENFWDKQMPNHVVIQIQPNEGIGLRLVAKKPGLTTVLQPVDMEFCYKTSFDTPQPDAYERLLMDVMLGDQTLFIGQVGESWKVIDPIEEVWQSGKPKLAIYKPGGWGPKEADEIIEKDNRKWLTPYLTICKI